MRGLEESLVHFARRTSAGPIISDHFSPVLASAVQMYLPNWRHVALNTAALRQNLSISFLQKLNQATNEEQVCEALTLLPPSSLSCITSGVLFAKTLIRHFYGPFRFMSFGFWLAGMVSRSGVALSVFSTLRKLTAQFFVHPHRLYVLPLLRLVFRLLYVLFIAIILDFSLPKLVRLIFSFPYLIMYIFHLKRKETVYRQCFEK